MKISTKQYLDVPIPLLLTKQQIIRIAQCFNLSQNADNLNSLCFEKAWELCLQKEWKLLDPIHEELSLLLDDSGSPLIIKAANGNKEELVKDLIKHTIDLQKLAFFCKQHKQESITERILLISLKIREKFLREDDPRRIYAYMLLAGYYENKKKYLKAIELYQQSALLYKKSVGEMHSLTINAYLHLSSTYAFSGQSERAAEIYNKHVDIYTKTLEKKHIDIINDLQKQAFSYLEQKRYIQAEEGFQNILSIQKQIFKKNHRDTAKTHSYIAFSTYRQYKYEKAIQHCKTSFDINKSILGERNPYTNAALIQLSLSYLAQGKYLKAERIIKKAQHLLTSESLPSQQAKTLGVLASCSIEKAEYSQAQEQLQKAACIYLDFIAEKKENDFCPLPLLSEYSQVSIPSELATTAITFAKLYQKQGQYKQALSFIRIALSIHRKVLTNKISVAQSLNTFALCFYKQGEYTQAEKIYRLALLFRHKEHTGPERSSSLLGLASCFYRKSQYIQAENLCIEAVLIQERIFGDKNLQLAQALTSLGCCYREQGLVNRAAVLFKEVLLTYISSGRQDPGLANAYYNLATSYLLQNLSKKAKVFFRKATFLYMGIATDEKISSLSPHLIFGNADSLDTLSFGLAKSLSKLSICHAIDGFPKKAQRLQRLSFELYEKIFF